MQLSVSLIRAQSYEQHLLWDALEAAAAALAGWQLC